MAVVQHTLETSAEPKAVWELWQRVEGWPEWQDGLLGARLEGPLKAGTRGRLKVRGGSRRFAIVQVVEGALLVWEVRGFLRRARVEYRLEPTDMGCRLTHRIDISGLGVWMDPWFREGRLTRSLPEGVRRLARLAVGMDR